MVPRAKGYQMKMSSVTDVEGFVRWLSGMSLARRFVDCGQLIDYTPEQRETLTEVTIQWLDERNYEDVTASDVADFQFNHLEAHLAF